MFWFVLICSGLVGLADLAGQSGNVSQTGLAVWVDLVGHAGQGDLDIFAYLADLVFLVGLIFVTVLADFFGIDLAGQACQASQAGLALSCPAES